LFLDSLKSNIISTFSFIQNSKVAVAFSGGSDSTALVHGISMLREKLNITLYAMHVNHNLRKESTKELGLIKEICIDLNVPVIYDEIPPSFWGDRSNMEQRARTKRYELFRKLGQLHEIKYVLTAHHLDDQVETILMRMLDRGTGVKGLAGISKTMDIEDITIVRPMLSIPKKQIVEFLKDRIYLTDPTNVNTNIRRNYFRHEVVPVLEERLGQLFKNNIGRLCESTQGELVFISEMAKEFWGNFIKSDNSYYIDREMIDKYEDRFWLTAFSHFFSINHTFSHRMSTLKDIVMFVKKRDPGKASYNPFVFERDKYGVRIVDNCHKI